MSLDEMYLTSWRISFCKLSDREKGLHMKGQTNPIQKKRVYAEANFILCIASRRVTQRFN